MNFYFSYVQNKRNITKKTLISNKNFNKNSKVRFYLFKRIKGSAVGDYMFPRDYINKRIVRHNFNTYLGKFGHKFNSEYTIRKPTITGICLLPWTKMRCDLCRNIFSINEVDSSVKYPEKILSCKNSIIKNIIK